MYPITTFLRRCVITKYRVNLSLLRLLTNFGLSILNCYLKALKVTKRQTFFLFTKNKTNKTNLTYFTCYSEFETVNWSTRNPEALNLGQVSSLYDVWFSIEDSGCFFRVCCLHSFLFIQSITGSSKHSLKFSHDGLVARRFEQNYGRNSKGFDLPNMWRSS